MHWFKRYKAIVAYARLMGISWIWFRIRYALKKRLGYFDKVDRRILRAFQARDKRWFTYKKVGLIRSDFQGDSCFIERAERAIKGRIYAFSHCYLDYTKEGRINWQMNPLTKVEADASLPWHKLPDFGDYGDIKLIWEASRFPQVYFFIHAYAATKDEKYARACIEQILEWIASNPYPFGVNYKCGQEITFRLFAWINALEYFYPFFSADEMRKVCENIYISLLRIEANIEYAVKSVRNNHSVSEAAGLLVGGLLFSQFPFAQRLRDKGLRYLLQETDYQVYDDGAYIQHSFTYERLAIDVLSFVCLVARKCDFAVPEVLRQRRRKMTAFLYAFVQKRGRVPNYGSNDGANVFPVTCADYGDFRPSIDFAMGRSDFFDTDSVSETYPQKRLRFDEGGYYIVKNSDIFAFMRCHTYRHRPAQNDMMHLDIWYKGNNIFCDSGSYSYNTDTRLKHYFIGTAAHNTVMINRAEQMERVLHFGYAPWARARCIEANEAYMEGESEIYLKRFGIIHRRSLHLQKRHVKIVDRFLHVKQPTHVMQIWNTLCDVTYIDEHRVKVDGCIVTSNATLRIQKGYISHYYNEYQEGHRLIFELHIQRDEEIVTRMEFVS